MNLKHMVLLVVAALVLLSAPAAQAFYNPQTGRWLSRDPIGDEAFLRFHARRASPAKLWRLKREGDLSYLFVRNQPTTRVDRLGLDAAIVDGDLATSAHTGIQVDLWDSLGHKIGCLRADYHAFGYMGDGGNGGGNSSFGSSSGSSGSSGSGSSGSGELITTASTKGRVTLRVCPPDKCTAPTRVVKGSMEKDRQFVDYILSTADASAKSWYAKALQDVQNHCIAPKCQFGNFDGAKGWQTYRWMSNNCNDYTDSALDSYLGYNWCWEIMTDGADLVQQWDERFPPGRR